MPVLCQAYDPALVRAVEHARRWLESVGERPVAPSATADFAGADSWATDAHKTLNEPYDCGIAIVADRAVMRSTFGVHTSYLMDETTGPGNAYEKVPELSRRARGVPVWAVLRSLGSDGVVALVDDLTAAARGLAAGIATIEGAEVLNDVVYTQVCVSFGDDERTRAVTARLIAGGVTWMSGSRWHDRDVLRVSVSNWSTDAADVHAAVEAVRRAAAEAAETAGAAAP